METRRESVAEIPQRDGRLTFAWKDHPTSAGSKLMTLEAQEFIRRVLLHVLPDGLTRSATSASGVTVWTSAHLATKAGSLALTFFSQSHRDPSFHCRIW